ncbi:MULTISPECIES: hypothetical protein [unclassified Bradyrhizobium]|uniref:hypothetical protein n=1 Tax=unclassified Bradyrhizobium TaxID=2631580 RepID=UPI0028F07ED5|nr:MULTISPECIES: hypothetical protein [unclassified Bradyrhizobium]
MYKPILRDWIWADGRGPELRRGHFFGHGLNLIALDYLNPDWASEDDMRHLILHKVQVHQVTPEEVHDYSREIVSWGPAIDQAAVVDLGKSDWLLSFAQRHLARCRHFRIMFYDEYVDVICESITAAHGAYAPGCGTQ